MRALRTALVAAGAALLAAALPSCRGDNAAAVSSPPDDRGGVAQAHSEQIGAAHPASPAETGYQRRSRGPRAQLTSGVPGSASGDLGSTPTVAGAPPLG